jgi:hypothetical protein
MSNPANQLALDALGFVVLSGIGFLVWSFGRLMRESRAWHGFGSRLLRSVRSRH